MRRAAMALAGLVCLSVPPPAMAQVVEITRDCFPGFCVESQEPFIVIARDSARGEFRLKVFRTGSTIYVEAGPSPRFPRCGSACRIEEGEGERRALDRREGRVSGRLVGPLAACGEGPTRFVHLYAYLRDTDLAGFTVTRRCG